MMTQLFTRPCVVHGKKSSKAIANAAKMLFAVICAALISTICFSDSVGAASLNSDNEYNTAARENYNDSEELEDDTPPLHYGSNPVSAVNLAASVLSTLTSVMMFIITLKQSKDNIQNWQNHGTYKPTGNVLLLIFSIIVGAAAPAIYLATESIHDEFCAVNQWTPLICGIVGVQVLLLLLFRRSRLRSGTEE